MTASSRSIIFTAPKPSQPSDGFPYVSCKCLAIRSTCDSPPYIPPSSLLYDPWACLFPGMVILLLDDIPSGVSSIHAAVPALCVSRYEPSLTTFSLPACIDWPIFLNVVVSMASRSSSKSLQITCDLVSTCTVKSSQYHPVNRIFWLSNFSIVAHMHHFGIIIMFENDSNYGNCPRLPAPELRFHI